MNAKPKGNHQGHRTVRLLEASSHSLALLPVCEIFVAAVRSAA
jgi:hypothetical protein